MSQSTDSFGVNVAALQDESDQDLNAIVQCPSIE
jgi:hypothetical protein